MGGGVLTIICSSSVGGTSWRSAVYTARDCCSMGVYWVFIPSRILQVLCEPKILGGTLSFCCLCHSAQLIPSRDMDAFNSSGSPAWEKPRALICFTSIFAFSKVVDILMSRLIHALSLPGGIRNGDTVEGREYNLFKTLKSLRRLAFLLHS